MPTILPTGRGIFGGLEFGTPFVDDFQRRFDQIVGQVSAGQQGVANTIAAAQAAGGPQTRALGEFGPVGGRRPGGGTGGGSGLPAPPGPTGGANAARAGAGGGTGIPAPPGGAGGGGRRATNGAAAGQSSRAGIPNLNNL